MRNKTKHGLGVTLDEIVVPLALFPICGRDSQRRS